MSKRTIEQRLFTTKHQIAFLKQWIKADKFGLSTQDFCRSLVANGTDAQKKIGQAGLEADGKGLTFVKVLEGWLPKLVLSSIRSADAAGKRSVGLETAIDQLNGGENIIAKLMKMMAFPYFILIGAGIYGLYISAKMLEVVEFAPGLGLTVRNFVLHYGLFFALTPPVILSALSALFPYWKGDSRKAVASLPLFNIYQTAVAASILKNLANLTKCGLNIDTALKEVAESNTRFAQFHLAQMRRQAIGQNNLGLILDTGLILPYELGAMKVLGGIADSHELLAESAISHTEEVDKRLKTMQVVLPKIGLFMTIFLLGGLIASSTYQVYSQMS